MKHGCAESVRTAVKKSPARKQRHGRVSTHEAQYRIEHCIVGNLGFAHSCLSVVMSKVIVVLMASRSNARQHRLLSALAMGDVASFVSGNYESHMNNVLSDRDVCGNLQFGMAMAIPEAFLTIECHSFHEVPSQWYGMQLENSRGWVSDLQ